MKPEKPRFRVVELSFIGHSLCQVGQEVFYTPPEGGHVSKNLSPLNDVAQAIVDGQKQDHPDKAIHAAKKAKAARQASEDEAEREEESGNGPLPKTVKAKGDTRSAKKPGKAAAKPEGGADTEAGGTDDDESDVA